MTTLYSNMSSEEKVRTLEVLYGIKDGLYDLLTLLKIQKANHSIDRNEVRQLAIKIADTEAAIFMTQARLIALTANEYAMQPPSNELHKQILEHVKSLDELVANAQMADTLVRASTQLITYLNQAAPAS